jgi:hypothetical protein
LSAPIDKLISKKPILANRKRTNTNFFGYIHKETSKTKAENEISIEIDEFLQPKIDIIKSQEKGNIVYKKSPGPK